MPLTDLAIRKAAASDSDRKVTDQLGLYLLVRPSGSKLWRYDYRFLGKRKTLSLGEYPLVTLQDARKRQADAREQLSRGI